MDNEYKSTRKSKYHYISDNNKKYWSSLYSSMFIDDFLNAFSIINMYKSSSRGDFSIESDNENLRKMITLNNTSYIDYKLSEIIRNLVYNMILKNKAFLEVVYYLDNEGIVKGFDFQVINYKRYIKTPKSTIFYYNTLEEGKNKINKFKIYNSNLICFKLSDIGLSSREFHRIDKKLKHLDITKLPIANSNVKIDIDKYEEDTKFELFSVTKNIPWNGREDSCKFITEYYQVYRLARLKMIELSILQYIFNKINHKIDDIGSKYDFSGKIVYNTISIDNIQDIIEKTKKGELQLEEAMEYLLSIKRYNENSI